MKDDFRWKTTFDAYLSLVMMTIEFQWADNHVENNKDRSYYVDMVVGRSIHTRGLNGAAT